MKKTLQEELQKIHNITYGKEIMTKDFLNDILSKIGLNMFDDPKKADLVSKDVEQLYTSLEDAIDKGGLSQQRKGSMGFQKEVESMQIGLTLLGYTLPKYGIDGLFGPETASAVSKFTTDNVERLKESASELRSTLDDLGYDEKGNELTSGGQITDEISGIVSDILKDYAKVKPKVNVVITAGNDNFHKNRKSRHPKGQAVDLVIKPHNSENARAFMNVLNNYKSKNSKFSYIDEYTHPTPGSTGGHFHLQYSDGKAVGGPSGKSVGSIATATSEMLSKLIELLKSKNIEDADIKQYIDPTVLASGGNEKSSSSSSNTSGSVESRWMDVTKKVIDNFEGGYWNYWECKNHPWHSMYKKSGETMFGLDRKAGEIEKLGPDGKEFFRIIDDEKKKLGMSNFCSKWIYNYSGGELEERLKSLASKIMYNEYLKNMSNYIKDPETKKRIEGNSGLLLHMAYATWNGPGHFQKFAKKLETAVKEGKSDEELLDIAKNNRTNTFTGDWAKATTRVNSLIDKTSGMS